LSKDDKKTTKEYFDDFKKETQIKKEIADKYSELVEIKKKQNERYPSLKTLSDQGKITGYKDKNQQKFSSLSDVFWNNKLSLAEEFYKRQPFFYDTNCMWWLWNKDKNKYDLIDETDIILIVDKYLGRLVPLLKERREIIEALKIIGRKKIPQEMPKHWIQFADCFYDIQEDEKIIPSYKFFCVNPIPWKLGDSEETPILDKLFSEWVNTEEEKNLLFEIIAYCLYPDYPLSRIFCIYGKGSNGKSVFLNILSNFVGHNNSCSTSLESLIDNRFESSKLYKKLFCRLSEIHDRIITKTSLLKNISGGDHISIEFKNKNPFDSLIYSKIIIGTNTIPITHDDTDGYFRRWLVIDFPNQFTEKRDVLSEIPEKEYENLTLKSIRLLKKILKERKFSFEGNLEDRKKRYNERANPIEAFIRDRCEVDINSDSIFSDVYNEFEKYLSEKSFRQMTKKEFGKSLRQMDFRTIKKTLNGFFSTYIEGLKLKKITQITEKTVSPLRFPIHALKLKQGNLGYFGNSSSRDLVLKILKVAHEMEIGDLISNGTPKKVIDSLLERGEIYEKRSGVVALLE